MKTQADTKQEEFFSSNGKLYINIEQKEITETLEDESIRTYWEMQSLEITDKRTAYYDVIEYYEKQQSRAIRELAVDPENQYAKAKILEIDSKIEEYRQKLS